MQQRLGSGTARGRCIGGQLLPAVAVLVVVGLSGCSNTVSDDPSTGETSSGSTGVDRREIQRQGEEAQAGIRTCMEERGFAVENGPAGEVQYLIPEGEGGDEVLLQNLSECEQGVDLPDAPPATREELGGMYELELNRIECLKDNGFEPAPPPSREKYIEDRQQLEQAGGGTVYDPLDPGLLEADDDIMQLQEACPSPRLADL